MSAKEGAPFSQAWKLFRRDQPSEREAQAGEKLKGVLCVDLYTDSDFAVAKGAAL